MKEIKRRDNVLEILTSFKFPADSRLFCGSEVAFLSSSCQFKVNPWNDLELRAGAKRQLQCIVLMSTLSVFAAFQDDVMLCTAVVGYQEKVDSWFTRDNDQIRGEGECKTREGGGWFNWDRLGRGTFGAFIARRPHIVRWVLQPACLWM